jgi:hypothetical protein
MKYMYINSISQACPALNYRAKTSINFSYETLLSKYLIDIVGSLKLTVILYYYANLSKSSTFLVYRTGQVAGHCREAVNFVSPRRYVLQAIRSK